MNPVHLVDHHPVEHDHQVDPDHHLPGDRLRDRKADSLHRLPPDLLAGLPAGGKSRGS